MKDSLATADIICWKHKSKQTSKKRPPIHISDTMWYITKLEVYDIRYILSTCFFEHESLKTDSEKDNDEMKKCKFTRKN